MKLDDETQRSFWEKATQRSHDHPVVREFARQRIDFLRDQLDFSSIRSALDVGCGTGFSSHYFSQIVPNLWAVDRSRHMLLQNPVPRTRLVQADAYALPFQDNSFDLVYCWELLHHTERPLAVLAEMRRVSARYLVFFEPNRANPAQALYAIVSRHERGVLRFSSSFLHEMARQSKLRIIYSATVGCIFPNKTPVLMLALLRRLRFEIPLLGISHVLICEKGQSKAV
ncbi:MAG: class I SAM-dependent methyltransferase [Candidatus Binatia bacterium]